MAQPEAPKSKLEEQASAKADLSYSYWAANAASGAPPPEPKKLTEEEAAAHQEQLKHTESGASAWNAAGTFEERSISLSWVKEQLAQLLGEVAHSRGGADVAVEELTSCSGEAHQWLVRGKKRAGFELCFEFRWSAALGDGSTVTGTAKVPHAAADELDELTLEVTADSPAADGGSGEGGAAPALASQEQRAAAAAAVSSMQPLLEPLLERLLELCRQK